MKRLSDRTRGHGARRDVRRTNATGNGAFRTVTPGFAGEEGPAAVRDLDRGLADIVVAIS